MRSIGTALGGAAHLWTARDPLRREHARARGPRAALAEQALVATEPRLEPILRELDEVATALNNGVPAPGDEAAACSRPISI